VAGQFHPVGDLGEGGFDAVPPFGDDLLQDGRHAAALVLGGRYYVVNTGRIRLGGAVTSRGTHTMWSKTPSTPDPGSPGGIAAQLIWFGGNAKTTLCGLPALRNVSNVFTPAEVSCRECRKRWQAAMAKEQPGARQEPNCDYTAPVSRGRAEPDAEVVLE
jgi:hypothetical protein